MNDYYLRANTEAALYEALVAAGIVREIEDGWHVTDGHKYALDVVGKVYKPTGEIIEQDGVESPVMAAVPGYHANLRVMDASNFDAELLAEVTINPPNNPARGWA
jgi:hypothetical protein